MEKQEQKKPAWGKLVSQTRGLGTYALKESQVIIGRNPEQCLVVITEKRLSSKHCLLQAEGSKIFLTDTSTNGTYINDHKEKVGKGNRIEIQDETMIWLLPSCRVSKDETIGFKLVLLGQFKDAYEQARIPEEKKEEKKERREETCESNFLHSLKEQITCCYCFEIMVFPVSIQPCNHRLCGPCLTELVLKKKDECIVCRRKMESAARDASFNTIIDEYLRSHPNENRKDEDEAPNIFGHEPKSIKSIINGGQEPEPEQARKEYLPQACQQNGEQVDQSFFEGLDNIERMQEEPGQKGKKRRKPSDKKQSKKDSKKQGRSTRSKSKKSQRFLNSDISASTDSQVQVREMEVEGPRVTCKECEEERKGFKCAQGQAHVNCHNCSKPFARREGEERLYQSCDLCHSFFCNLYLPPCQKNGPKLVLLGNRGPTCLVEPLYFRNNKVEMDAFRNLLVSEKKKVIDMFQEMLKLAESGRFEFMFDRRLLRAQPAVERTVRLHKRSAVCDNCWRQLWFQMIFVYVKENAYLMPETIKNRPPCYWGINCRTMEHNVEHAKRYNHMEFQTRF